MVKGPTGKNIYFFLFSNSKKKKEKKELTNDLTIFYAKCIIQCFFHKSIIFFALKYIFTKAEERLLNVIAPCCGYFLLGILLLSLSLSFCPCKILCCIDTVSIYK